MQPLFVFEGRGYYSRPGLSFKPEKVQEGPDEWAAETDAGAVLLVTRTGPGAYDIETAPAGACVERCYACGRLYVERREFVESRLQQHGYDPTDFECGCTRRWLEAQAEVVDEWVHVDPCDNDCDLYRELDASIRQAVLAQDWRA